jgi:ATP-binding cassette subfamily A (ABC1) protein 3
MSLAFSLAFNSKEYFIDLFKSLEEDPSITVDLYMNTLEEAFINIGIDEEKFMKRTRRYSIGESPNEDAHIEVQAGHNAFTDFSSIVAPECIKHSPSYSFWL